MFKIEYCLYEFDKLVWKTLKFACCGDYKLRQAYKKYYDLIEYLSPEKAELYRLKDNQWLMIDRVTAVN